MNRYVLRSLVAILAFLIGLAVTPSRRSFGYHYRDRQFTRSVRRAYHCDHDRTQRTPSLSVDSVATDPVKASYLQTQSAPEDLSKQKVELLLDNKGSRNIGSVILSYITWSPSRNSQRGTLRIRFDGNQDSDPSLQTVAVECNPDESVWMWISYVEYKDGTRWMNPRHPDDQALQ